MNTPRALPTFFVIGAAKSGTTSLSRYLNRHPEVAMTDPKEPHLLVGSGWQERAHGYERLFPPDAKLRGDASTGYSHPGVNPDAPGNIAELVPDARLIYLVRDPVERTITHYRHHVTSGDEHRQIDVAIRPEDPGNYYVAASLYSTVVEAYLKRFDPAQLLVIEFTDLRHARADVLARVFAHIGADPNFWDDSFAVEHNVQGIDNVWFPGPVRRLQSGRFNQVARRLLPRSPRRWLMRRVRQTMGPEVPTDASPMLKARLAEVLKPQAERLRALTGQAFDQWSV